MTLDEAVAAVEATLVSPRLCVDRRQAREDDEAFLVVVLQTGAGRHDDGPVEGGPRLVDRASGQVTRLVVTDAVARAGRMRLATAPQEQEAP